MTPTKTSSRTAKKAGSRSSKPKPVAKKTAAAKNTAARKVTVAKTAATRKKPAAKKASAVKKTPTRKKITTKKTTAPASVRTATPAPGTDARKLADQKQEQVAERLRELGVTPEAQRQPRNFTPDDEGIGIGTLAASFAGIALVGYLAYAILFGGSEPDTVTAQTEPTTVGTAAKDVLPGPTQSSSAWQPVPQAQALQTPFAGDDTLLHDIERSVMDDPAFAPPAAPYAGPARVPPVGTPWFPAYGTTAPAAGVERSADKDRKTTSKSTTTPRPTHYG